MKSLGNLSAPDHLMIVGQPVRKSNQVVVAEPLKRAQQCTRIQAAGKRNRYLPSLASLNGPSTGIKQNLVKPVQDLFSL
jgi:hypothetical protein